MKILITSSKCRTSKAFKDKKFRVQNVSINRVQNVHINGVYNDHEH